MQKTVQRQEQENRAREELEEEERINKLILNNNYCETEKFNPMELQHFKQRAAGKKSKRFVNENISFMNFNPEMNSNEFNASPGLFL